MTLQTLNSPTGWSPYIPMAGQALTSIGSDSTFTFNGAGDKMAFVFQGPAVAFDQIKFRCATFSTLGTIDVTIETVDATTGQPTGTQASGSNLASVSVTSTGVKTVTGLAGSFVPTPGVLYAVVLTATGVFVGNFTLLRTTGTNGSCRLPYSLTKDSAGAWTKVATTNVGFAIGLFTASGIAIPISGFSGAYSAAFVTYGSGTNPNERGNRFSCPGAIRLWGFTGYVVNGSVPADINSMELDVYTSHTSGSPVLLTSQAFDGDVLGQSGGGDLMLGTPQIIAPNTVFAGILKATGSTGPTLIRWQFASNAEVGGLLDINCYSTSRNGSGAFTDVNTDVYSLFPKFDQIDDGTGGGTGYHPSMNGNFQ